MNPIKRTTTYEPPKRNYYGAYGYSLLLTVATVAVRPALPPPVLPQGCGFGLFATWAVGSGLGCNVEA